MSIYTDLKQSYTKDYQNTLRKLEDSKVLFDIAKHIQRKWLELSGTTPAMYPYAGKVRIWVYLDRIKPNGQYPTMTYDVGQLVEYIDQEVTGVIPFDEFEHSFGNTSSDYTWGKGKIELCVVPGGNCVLEQVGEKVETVTKPIYEMQCN